MSPWRKPTAFHDPGKIVLDLAVALALGGTCLADIALLREQPGVFGPVASDPTVSRAIDTLAADAPAALAAIAAARAAARSQVWARAGKAAPDADVTAARPLVIDVDATLVTAHSEKKTPDRPTSAATASTRYGPSPTTARTAVVSRWRCCCARATPGATPPPTTSWCSSKPSRSSRPCSEPTTPNYRGVITTFTYSWWP